MYNSPYYHYQPVRRDYPYYVNYSNPTPNPSQQLHEHPFHSSNGQALYQTPYEQFAKPKQPSFSPNHIPINPTPYQPLNPSHSNPTTTEEQTDPNMYAQDTKEQVDFDKMLTTVGQLANTYHQVSPIVKQFGTIIKGFR
ncbi:hypothetical protein J2Z83_003584 [Virgibacillus natechei]|uniref:Spore coat protein n=1 Tax=Virgibacillus natechei TaxID=1216297 RepID=A0ABS4IKL3_9BACI|nr:YppG family protein [Virgibacillus natechei]MBP1971445.1 hypothetical protein [Virgibacillus natechei]UZD13814.1 YppG family protein [Virgibacillus natechei]